MEGAVLFQDHQQQLRLQLSRKQNPSLTEQGPRVEQLEDRHLRDQSLERAQHPQLCSTRLAVQWD